MTTDHQITAIRAGINLQPKTVLDALEANWQRGTNAPDCQSALCCRPRLDIGEVLAPRAPLYASKKRGARHCGVVKRQYSSILPKKIPPRKQGGNREGGTKILFVSRYSCRSCNYAIAQQTASRSKLKQKTGKWKLLKKKVV